MVKLYKNNLKLIKVIRLKAYVRDQNQNVTI